jgi:hypothetical protein
MTSVAETSASLMSTNSRGHLKAERVLSQDILSLKKINVLNNLVYCYKSSAGGGIESSTRFGLGQRWFRYTSLSMSMANGKCDIRPSSPTLSPLARRGGIEDIEVFPLEFQDATVEFHLD